MNGFICRCYHFIDSLIIILNHCRMDFHHQNVDISSCLLALECCNESSLPRLANFSTQLYEDLKFLKQCWSKNPSIFSRKYTLQLLLSRSKFSPISFIKGRIYTLGQDRLYCSFIYHNLMPWSENIHKFLHQYCKCDQKCRLGATHI